MSPSGKPSPIDLAAMIKQDPMVIAKLFGVDLNTFLPDDESPDVDVYKIRRLLAGELSPAVTADLLDMIRAYRPHFRALIEVVTGQVKDSPTIAEPLTRPARGVSIAPPPTPTSAPD